MFTRRVVWVVGGAVTTLGKCFEFERILHLFEGFCEFEQSKVSLSEPQPLTTGLESFEIGPGPGAVIFIVQND